MMGYIDSVVSRLQSTQTVSEPPELPASSAEPLDINDVTEVLGNQRRRWVIDDLEKNGETTLKDMVARRSEYVYGADYSGTERRREYVTLYQNHLPMMDRLDVVDYHNDGDTAHSVAKGENFDAYLQALGGLVSVCESTTEL